MDRSKYHYWRDIPRSLDSDTELRSLTIEAGLRRDCNEPDIVRTISNLLEFSPLLERLALRLRSESDVSSVHGRLIPLIGKLPHLLDLAWLEGDFPLRGSELGNPAFASLRRLVLPHTDFILPVRRSLNCAPL
jgi:hypothetical protein